ncbi:MAG: hypothetical protein AMJ65_15070 [Phycisphaerae bacterium SG8_4]|nr:MAG: hypothetical protein AMJ65_15070 [Phycisphaerae bacterium SG8_4]
MSKTACNLRIGTSGWYYDHWKDVFYPAGLTKGKWFEHYAQNFDTVEINNTFYHLPKEQTLNRWHDIAPEGFLYAVKANRFITHIKRLKDAAQPLERFFERVRLLGKNLGPVLYQLPPSLHKDLDLLGGFVKLLPKKPPAVFEFRHESWYADDTFKLLTEANVGFCIHDMPGTESPRVVTSGTIYVRFHGRSSRYAGSYPKSALQEWATWLKEKARNTRSIYAYFNNDIQGHAIKNAKQLTELLS